LLHTASGGKLRATQKPKKKIIAERRKYSIIDRTTIRCAFSLSEIFCIRRRKNQIQKIKLKQKQKQRQRQEKPVEKQKQMPKQ